MTDGDTRQVRIIAVIPAFNEATHIAGIVEQVREHGCDVAVVDDGSSDATAELAEAAGAIVLRMPVNLGYGGALQTGYLYARDRNYDLVVQLDGDGQHDPAGLPELWQPILDGQADVVIGSRFLGGASYPVPWVRRLGQRLFGGLAGLLIGRRISDPTSGLQALSREVVAAYCTRIFPDDYPDADMFVVLHRMGFRVAEVPARMRPSDGESMHSGILRPPYYVYKMSLALLASLIKKLPVRRGS